MTAKSIAIACFSLTATAGLVAILVADEVRKVANHGRWLQHDISRPRPPVVEPVGSPPAAPTPGARGRRRSVRWHQPRRMANAGGRPARWKVSDGYMEVAPGTGAIHTRAKFGDVQLHVEWASPKPAVGKGQDRGNSGIFLMGQFEVQVIDSYQADTYADGQAGALYGQYPPLANASRPARRVADLRHRLSPPSVRSRRQADRAGPVDGHPQRHSRSKQRRALGWNQLARAGALRPPRAIVARSSSRTTAIKCGSAISGCANCPNALRRRPIISPGGRSFRCRPKCWIR